MRLRSFRSYAAEPRSYLGYDNYDAINADKTADIPMDYDGGDGCAYLVPGYALPGAVYAFGRQSLSLRASFC